MKNFIKFVLAIIAVIYILSSCTPAQAQGNAMFYTTYSPNSTNKINYGISVTGKFIGVYFDYGARGMDILATKGYVSTITPMGKSVSTAGYGETHYNRYLSTGYQNINFGIIFNIKNKVQIGVGVNNNRSVTYDNTDSYRVYRYGIYDMVNYTTVINKKITNALDITIAVPLVSKSGFAITPTFKYNQNQGFGVGLGIGGAW